MLRMQKFQEIMCFHRHFKVFCLDLKPKTHQNNINSDFIGLLGFVCNFYFVKFAQICCADSIALAREHGIERKHCARLFTLAFVRFNFNLAHLPFGFVNSAAKCYHSTSQSASQSVSHRSIHVWVVMLLPYMHNFVCLTRTYFFFRLRFQFLWRCSSPILLCFCSGSMQCSIVFIHCGSACQRHRWLLCCYYTLKTHFYFFFIFCVL